MLLTKEVTIIGNPNNKKQYEAKGYQVEINKPLQIKVEDLGPYCEAKIQYRCDICGEIITTTWATYYKKPKNGLDCCYKCKYTTTKLSLQKKYWEDIINPMQLQSVQEKVKYTCIEKYGTEWALSNSKIIQKRIDTNIKKYGVSNPMMVEEISQKQHQTLYENHTAPCSKQQQYVWEILGGELNYPVNNLFLDIAYSDQKIYIEWNGGGHNLAVKIGTMTTDEFNKKEIARDRVLKKYGWKKIEINSPHDVIPSDEVLHYIYNFSLDILQNNLLNWIEFNIDEKYIRYKNAIIDFDFINIPNDYDIS